MSEIRDITLAPEGEKKIRWVEERMPVLKSICEDFEKTQPFKGLKVTVSVHLEAKTGYLACVMKAGGADVYVTGSNVLSTQDDVYAAMLHDKKVSGGTVSVIRVDKPGGCFIEAVSPESLKEAVMSVTTGIV